MSLFKQIRTILNKPESAPTAPTETFSTPTERRRKKRTPLKGLRILVIDDSATILASLTKMLHSAGCITLEASDAESGLKIASDERPDLVFLDIVLPGMNGFAALRLMRRDPNTKHIPVIMISGNEQATEQFYAKRIGADDFMKKPFARFEVFARIEQLSANRKLPTFNPDGTVKTPAMPTITTAPAPAAAPAPATEPRGLQASANMTNEAVSRMTAIEARTQLTAMGLQYFNQQQFNAAIQRNDRLAVDLFIIGGGVNINQ